MLDDGQIETLRRLLQLADHYRVAELEVEAGGLTFQIKGPASATGAGASGAAGADLLDLELLQEMDGADPDALPENHHAVLSPMTGTFFRAEGPESPAYVETGQHVDEGQPVGLIEAMKVFSQVPADAAGRVVEIRVKNAQLVQQGDLLMVIETD